MKTAKEIEQWLKKQKWCKSFMLQTLAAHDHKTAIEIINGSRMQWTIAFAFDWGYSIEGSSYWTAIHCKFIKWYNNENRETN